jgi:putative ABC transport system permease protein
MVPLSYNLRNLTVRKATTIATATGLAIVVFIFSSVLMLSNSVERTLGRAADPSIALVMRKGADTESASGIEEPNTGIVLSSPGIAKNDDGTPMGIAEAVVLVLLEKIGVEGLANVQVRGVPDHALAFHSQVRIVDGRPARAGTDEVIIGQAIRGRFKGLELGQSFELGKNRVAKIVGVFSADGSAYESEIWGDIHTVQAAFGREALVSSIRVRLESPSSFDAFRASVLQNRQLELDVIREVDYFDQQANGTRALIQSLGTLMAVLFGLGAIIGAVITMHSSVDNRRREIGTLRALGFPKLQILISFLIESIILALFGGAIGVLASMSMSFLTFSTVNIGSWSEVVFTFEPTPSIIVSSLLAAIILGFIGGFFPALKAARMSPLQAIQNT